MTSDPVALKQGRKTALLVGAVLLALGGWSWWRAHPSRAALFSGAGALLILAGAVAPRWALAFHRGWMRFALALGYVNSRLILSVMYYGILAPLGLLTRLVGRDPLNRRRKPAESYWIPRSKPRQDREQFERLF